MKKNILSRYIAKNVLSAIALVTLMLAGLETFILFVNQLDELGKANYNLIQASYFVLLQTPYQVYLFFPMASLLGSLIGLGLMATHRELVVIRAAGMSIAEITYAVLKASLIVIVLITILGETLFPRLVSLSNDKKLHAMSEGQALRTEKGLWLRYRNDFVTIGTIDSSTALHSVYQFKFDINHHLRLARKMDLVVHRNGHWNAYGVAESSINKEQIHTKHVKEMNWDIPLNPKLLTISRNEPDEMTWFELKQFLKLNKFNQQSSRNHLLAYWQRLLQPLTTAIMMVLAIPFIFGPLRSSTMGAKLLAGTAVGFGFYIVNRIFGPISQVLQWPVEVAAFGPPMLFMLLAIYLMKRMR